MLTIHAWPRRLREFLLTHPLYKSPKKNCGEKGRCRADGKPSKNLMPIRKIFDGHQIYFRPPSEFRLMGIPRQSSLRCCGFSHAAPLSSQRVINFEIRKYFSLFFNSEVRKRRAGLCERLRTPRSRPLRDAFGGGYVAFGNLPSENFVFFGASH